MSDASSGTVTTHDLRRTFISHLIVRLGLDPIRANVSGTLIVYARSSKGAMQRDELIARINQAGSGLWRLC